MEQTVGGRTIVVMGAGVWAKHYAQALRSRVSPNDQVFIVYDSRAGQTILEPGQFHRYHHSVLSNIVMFEAWGDIFTGMDFANFLNRADLTRKEIDVVFIVSPAETHCEYARFFLKYSRCIVVETPFDASVKGVDILLNSLGINPIVWGFESLYVRMHELFLSDAWAEFLGGDLARENSFCFFMLEAGADRIHRCSPSLQHGFILEMAVHSLMVLLPFGKLKDIQTHNVYAAAYTGADQYIRPQWPNIGGRETFGCIDFGFTSFKDTAAKGRICIGQNVGRQAETFAEVIGENGNSIRIDFMTGVVSFRLPGQPHVSDACTAEQLDMPDCQLLSDPIPLLVDEVFRCSGDFSSPPLDSMFDPQIGREIVNQLEIMRTPVSQWISHDRLPEYTPGEPWGALMARLAPLP